jgi:thiamine biosynthesis lipoprotein
VILGRHNLAVFSMIAAIVAGPIHQARPQRFEFSQPHMGTQVRVVVYAPDAATAWHASRAAFRRIALLDDTMSDYKTGSELMRLCRSAGGPPVRVSRDLFHVLARAQEIAQQTNGAFDVTVGPVVRLWRRARRRADLPDAAELTSARKLVGYKYLRLDPKARTVQLLKRGMLLDLGGIAKGYAADVALTVLKRYGISSALVAAGGDIAVGAPPPGEAGWSVGIAPLDSPSQLPTRFLALQNAGVSTSGDAEQFVEIAGQRYSHIIDPRTGQALTGHSSVTIVAPDATTSDAMATAFSVLGIDEAQELATSLPGLGVFFAKQTASGVRTYERAIHVSTMPQGVETRPER